MRGVLGRRLLDPFGQVLAEADAILALGVVVAGELGLPCPPVLVADIDAMRTGMDAEISAGGIIRLGQ